jgi:hypothetical protein
MIVDPGMICTSVLGVLLGAGGSSFGTLDGKDSWSLEAEIKITASIGRGA